MANISTAAPSVVNLPDCKQAVRDWVTRQGSQLFVTLVFNLPMTEKAALEALRGWHLSVDRMLLKREWAKKPEMRTQYVAVLENVQTLAHAPVQNGRVNQAALRMIFAEQIRGWQESLEIALASKPPVPPGGSASNGSVNLSYSEAEFHEDNIRTALRGQARALKELGPSLFSRILVEQVESDFHSVSGQDGHASAKASVVAGPDGQADE